MPIRGKPVETLTYTQPQYRPEGPTIAPKTEPAPAPVQSKLRGAPVEAIQYVNPPIEPEDDTFLGRVGATVSSFMPEQVAPDMGPNATAIAPDTSGLTAESDPLGERATLNTPMLSTEFSASQASEDLPMANRMKLMLSDLFIRDPNTVAQIIEANDPGATIQRDEQGNAINVVVDGRTMPLNRPGITGRDIGSLIGPTAAFFATRGLGALLLGGATRGLTVNAALSGAGGIGEVAATRGVEAVGGGREVSEDLLDYPIGAAAGAGGELAGRAVSALVRGVIGLPGVKQLLQRGVRITGPDGQLNETGVALVRQAGANPDAVTPGMARNIQAEVDRLAPQFALGAEAVPSVTRQAAPTNAAVNRAFATQTGIPATTGGLTGVEKQLGREFNLEGRKLLGPALRGRKAEAEEALGAIAQTRGGLGETASDQAAAITAGITEAGDAARRASSNVYQSIKSRLTGGTTLDLSLREFGKKVARPLRDARQGFPDIDFNALPKADAARRYVLDFARRMHNRSNVPFQEIEALRRGINSRYIKGTRDPAEINALSRVVQTLDNWVDAVRVRGEARGATDLLDDTVKARRLWRDYMRTFQSGRAGETVTRDVLREAVSDIGAVGRFFRPTTGPAAVRQLQKATGVDSPAMNTLRESAWRKLLAKPNGEPKTVAQASEAVSKALNEQSEIYRAIFRNDLRQLQRMQTALRNASRQPKVKQKTNPVSQFLRQTLTGLAAGRAVTGAVSGAEKGVGGVGGAIVGHGTLLAGTLGTHALKMAHDAARAGLAAAGRGTPARGLLETPAAAAATQGLLGLGE